MEMRSEEEGRRGVGAPFLANQLCYRAQTPVRGPTAAQLGNKLITMAQPLFRPSVLIFPRSNVCTIHHSYLPIPQ